MASFWICDYCGTEFRDGSVPRFQIVIGDEIKMLDKAACLVATAQQIELEDKTKTTKVVR